ncbi:unnamed protein product [Soboliphyme baturini]|uniref:Decapping nuclease n=1 Tax=Soboliphyme baturini TaxID=241478 RepID=A0A183J5D9_9BILA|nr:unnamed protein product [Soboliphyme baturini]
MSCAWLFENLRVEPYGTLPLSNLNAKGGPSKLKDFRQVSSYNWAKSESDDHKPTMVIPGYPKEFVYWNGGHLPPDSGQMIYDLNHLLLPDGPMDPVFEAVKLTAQDAGQEVNFQEYDIITDCINLRKIFAFCKGEDEGGVFRVDLERVGRMVIANRVEGADVITIDFDSFDENMKKQCAKPLTPILDGPHYQIVSYKFGDINMLVRFETDCANYGDQRPVIDDSKRPEVNTFSYGSLAYMKMGQPTSAPLISLTTFPQRRGFPSFAWPLLFFSGMQNMVVGWWQGNGDFEKPPASYNLQEINKLVKPIPYVSLSKVHDFLNKMIKFMRSNKEDLKIGLLWKGNQFIEIYEKASAAHSAISENVRQYLKNQVVRYAQTEETKNK